MMRQQLLRGLSVLGVVLALSLTSCDSLFTLPACTFEFDGRYYCWQDEYQDFCEAGGGTFYADYDCEDLGYTYHCTEEEVAPGLEDKWTVASGCDESEPPPPPPTSSGGNALTACQSPTGVCSELTEGDRAAFDEECRVGGDTVVASCSAGASQCLGASGTSQGQTVGLNIHWPGNICSQPGYGDVVYLQGTCESLGGSYSGDSGSCCSGTAVPAAGGAYCE